MNEVSTRKMSSDRQIGNQGKLGFVPTNKSIVEMELNLIDFSEIRNNQYTVNVCDLSGGTGEQLHWTHEYLKSMNICSNAYYNELSTERYSECVRRYDYIHALNGDFFNIKVGTKNNKALNKKVFSVIRNNPPYMYIEKRGRISFTEWKNSFSLTAMKDTIKYNMKYSSFKGMFSDGVAWKNRKDFIKTTANGFKSIIGVSQEIESIVVGEYSISEDIKGKLEEKKTGFSDLTTIKGKIEKLVTKTQGTYKNTYIYKSANATN